MNWSLDRAVKVQPPPRVRVWCSCTRHFTLKVPLSTHVHVYIIYQEKFNGGGNPVIDYDLTHNPRLQLDCNATWNSYHKTIQLWKITLSGFVGSPYFASFPTLMLSFTSHKNTKKKKGLLLDMDGWSNIARLLKKRSSSFLKLGISSSTALWL